MTLRIDNAWKSYPTREAGDASIQHVPRNVSLEIPAQSFVSLIGHSGCDHVVEVTVARLRRKLQQLGSAIVTVPRRGYAVKP